MTKGKGQKDVKIKAEVGRLQGQIHETTACSVVGSLLT